MINARRHTLSGILNRDGGVKDAAVIMMIRG